MRITSVRWRSDISFLVEACAKLGIAAAWGLYLQVGYAGIYLQVCTRLESYLCCASIFTRVGQTIRFMWHNFNVTKCYDL